jgi:hypothetical protein
MLRPIIYRACVNLYRATKLFQQALFGSGCWIETGDDVVPANICSACFRTKFCSLANGRRFAYPPPRTTPPAARSSMTVSKRDLLRLLPYEVLFPSEWEMLRLPASSHHASGGPLQHDGFKERRAPPASVRRFVPLRMGDASLTRLLAPRLRRPATA